MRLIGKITACEFEEARRIVWAPHYWLNLFNNFCFHRFGLLKLMGLFFLGMLSTSYLAATAHMSELVVGAITGTIGTSLLIWFVFSSRRPSVKMLKEINQTLPEFIDIENDGLSAVFTDGTIYFSPWSTFSDLKGEGIVIVLNSSNAGKLVVLPLEDLLIEDRASLFGTLKRHVGEPTRK